MDMCGIYLISIKMLLQILWKEILKADNSKCGLRPICEFKRQLRN